MPAAEAPLTDNSGHIMPPGKPKPTAERKAQLLAAIRRDHDLRQKGYRDQALRLYPHICARCGRELTGKRLRELTVHHKDHNHRNNPGNGSNWELLCLYCHDHEHEKYKIAGYYEGAEPEIQQPGPSIFKPFAALDGLIKPGNDTPPVKPAN